MEALQQQSTVTGTNVHPLERLASTALGSVLVIRGLQKRSPMKVAGALLGAGLVYRGVSGSCNLYRALGLNTAKSDAEGLQVSPSSPAVQRSITIGKSPEELYASWRNPETLSSIMAHFAEVITQGDGVTHWRTRGPLKSVLTWDSTYTEEHEGRKLEWKSVPGSTLVNGGEVIFRPGPDGTGSEVTLRLRFEPPLGPVGAAIAKALEKIPRTGAGTALRRFKSLMETGEIPTLANNPSGRGSSDLF